jgi:hypothetical protein
MSQYFVFDTISMFLNMVLGNNKPPFCYNRVNGPAIGTECQAGERMFHVAVLYNNFFFFL